MGAQVLAEAVLGERLLQKTDRSPQEPWTSTGVRKEPSRTILPTPPRPVPASGTRCPRLCGTDTTHEGLPPQRERCSSRAALENQNRNRASWAGQPCGQMGKSCT